MTNSPTGLMQRFRPYLLLVAKIAVTFACVALLARAVSWTALWEIFKSIRPGWAILALLIFWLAQIVSAYRCACIARRLGRQLDMKTSVHAHFLGLWFNQVLPTGLGGDVIKVATLKPLLGLGVAVRTALLDRLSGLALMMIAIAITLPLYADLFTQPGFMPGLMLVTGGFLLGLLLAPWIASHLQRRLQSFPKLSSLLQLAVDIGRFRTGRPLWEQAWTSTVVHFNGIIAYALLGLALGVPVDWLHFILIVPLVFLVALMPISLAGWGVREAGAVWLFQTVGIDSESALAMSICFGLMLIIAGLPGLWLFLGERPVSSSESAG